MCRPFPTKLVDVQTTQTKQIYVQCFVRAKTFVRSQCVQNSLCPDFRAFKILHDQTLVPSQPKFLCSNFEQFCAHVQTIVRSETPMFRLSCVQKCVCPQFRAYMFRQRFYNVFISSIYILGDSCDKQLQQLLHFYLIKGARWNYWLKGGASHAVIKP